MDSKISCDDSRVELVPVIREINNTIVPVEKVPTKEKLVEEPAKEEPPFLPPLVPVRMKKMAHV